MHTRLGLANIAAVAITIPSAATVGPTAHGTFFCRGIAVITGVTVTVPCTSPRHLRTEQKTKYHQTLKCSYHISPTFKRRNHRVQKERQSTLTLRSEITITDLILLRFFKLAYKR